MKLFHFLVGFLAQVAPAQCTDRASRGIPGASITYKKTIACGSVVSDNGYIRMTSTVVPGARHDTSTFFWFFPALNPTGANLALYLAGGPGEASSFAALTENGPCIAQKDGNSVLPNPFPFNQNAHVLYVDQPNQVGFSYDRIVSGVFDVLGGSAGSGEVIPGGVGSNLTNIQGRFASQNPAATARTSTMAAKSMWYFLQVFFADFDVNYGDHYSVSIWGNSYGGMYVSALASYILRTNSKLPVKANATYKTIRVPSIGITNGCMDIEAQGAAYATLPYNNTWNNPDGTPFRLYSKEQSDSILASAKSPGSCFDRVRTCRKLKASNDPHDEGTDEATNIACVGAAYICNDVFLSPYFSISNSRSQYDMGLHPADPNPPKYAANYLNKPSVRASLGVPAGLNYTLFSSPVFYNFFAATGDPTRDGSADLTYLLNQGTRVALIYGDRDWRCNWLGASNLTLALTWPSPRTPYFPTAGYTPFILPSSSPSSSSNNPPAAITRQHTLLSFTRVFGAGHAVTWYAPAVVQAIFNRVTRDVDVATGLSAGKTAVTQGKRGAWGWRGVLGPPPEGRVECSLWAVGSTCSAGQMGALGEGTARVVGWEVNEPAV